jgi:2'-5' RNA ligase
MAKSFVFLEISDPEISALIYGIRAVAMTSPPKTAPHITVRGPYARPVSRKELLRYGRILSPHPVVLEGIGAFQSGDRTTVYMKVQHPYLRQIWWKPDYPIKEFGFNPHVTLYEGKDADRAGRLQVFLRREDIKLLTSDFSVSPYVSDHKDLFPRAEGKERLFLSLINRSLVRADVLARLERALGHDQRAA